MWHVFGVERLDPELAETLGSNVVSAVLEIKRLAQGKDVSTERLLQLTETLHNLTNKPALERLDFETLDYELFNIVKFFGKMFDIDLTTPGKTVKEAHDEVFRGMREEIDNFRFVMDKKPEADFKRAIDFCVALHRHTLPYQRPYRTHLAA